MDIKRFEALADAYGGEIARWPEAERAEALTLVERNPAARALLEDAAALDAALRSAAVTPPPTGLSDKIIADGAGAGAASAPQPRWAAMAAALTLAIGLGAGWFAGTDPGATDAEIFAAAFGALGDDEVSALLEDA